MQHQRACCQKAGTSSARAEHITAITWARHRIEAPCSHSGRWPCRPFQPEPERLPMIEAPHSPSAQAALVHNMWLL